jgi:hypothetical protein
MDKDMEEKRMGKEEEEQKRTECRIGEEEEWKDITERTRIRENYYGLASSTVFHHCQLGERMKVNLV